jgi:hypothetical protein
VCFLIGQDGGWYARVEGRFVPLHYPDGKKMKAREFPLLTCDEPI